MELLDQCRTQAGNGDQGRWFATGMTHLEAAHMFAAKGLFQ